MSEHARVGLLPNLALILECAGTIYAILSQMPLIGRDLYKESLSDPYTFQHDGTLFLY